MKLKICCRCSVSFLVGLRTYQHPCISTFYTWFLDWGPVSYKMKEKLQLVDVTGHRPDG